jgi:hypothetical protein
MADRAGHQNSRVSGKFSRLDWPTPEMLVPAHRARGKALRDMFFALGSWLKRGVAERGRAASRPQETTHLDRSPVADR